MGNSCLSKTDAKKPSPQNKDSNNHNSVITPDQSNNGQQDTNSDIQKSDLAKKSSPFLYSDDRPTTPWQMSSPFNNETDTSDNVSRVFASINSPDKPEIVKNLPQDLDKKKYANESVMLTSSSAATNADSAGEEEEEDASVAVASATIADLPTTPNGDPIQFYLDQDIVKVRNYSKQTNKAFEDPFFLRTISSIIETTDSKLYLYLKTRLGACNKQELNKLIKWQRTQKITNDLVLKANQRNEFVLDDDGNALEKPMNRLDYATYFSFNDIFQGWIGNCFHVAAIMSLTRNEELLEFVVPVENTQRATIDSCGYNFRLWKTGVWYDVLVDDHLPSNGENNELLFSHNKVYKNEFWVPLFEKALAKFIGSYDELERTSFENAALFLSGGLHEEYKLKAYATPAPPPTVIKKDDPSSSMSTISNENAAAATSTSTATASAAVAANDKTPTLEEMLAIIKMAVAKKDMIGCMIEDEDMALKFGVYREHFYLITDIHSNQRNHFIRLHNPFNTPESIKSTLQYLEMEEKLCNMGLSPTTPGELWMASESFFKCFKKIKVCNLLPNNKIPAKFVTKDMAGLKLKTNIMTEWRCQTIRALFPASVRKIEWYQPQYAKQLVRIDSDTPKDILVSFVQDLIRKRRNTDAIVQKLNLQIYAYDNGIWKIYKVVWYAESLQWCMRLSLPRGIYLFVYTAGYELSNDHSYCFRVFTDNCDRSDDGSQKWIDVSAFDDKPPFDLTNIQ